MKNKHLAKNYRKECEKRSGERCTPEQNKQNFITFRIYNALGWTCKDKSLEDCDEEQMEAFSEEIFGAEDALRDGKCPSYPNCRPTQLCGDKSAWQDLATFENCVPIHCEALDKAPEV